MPTAFYALPLWVNALLVCGLPVALAMVFHWAIRKFAYAGARVHGDEIGVAILATATLYAVLLAMIAVAAWSDYADVNGRVRDEASIAGNLYRDAQGLPAAQRTQLRAQAREYVHVVAADEFPVMRRGEVPDASADVATKLMITALAFKPADLGEADVHQKILDELNRMLELRRRRQSEVDDGLISVLWWVVIAGGTLTILMMSWLVAEHVWTSYLLSLGFALMIGMIVFLIAAVDRPMMGEVSVSAAPFQYVESRMDSLDKVLRRVEPSIGTTAGAERGRESTPGQP